MTAIGMPVCEAKNSAPHLTGASIFVTVRSRGFWGYSGSAEFLGKSMASEDIRPGFRARPRDIRKAGKLISGNQFNLILIGGHGHSDDPRLTRRARPDHPGPDPERISENAATIGPSVPIASVGRERRARGPARAP